MNKIFFLKKEIKHKDAGEACTEFATVSLCTARIQSVTTLRALCSVTDSLKKKRFTTGGLVGQTTALTTIVDSEAVIIIYHLPTIQDFPFAQPHSERLLV